MRKSRKLLSILLIFCIAIMMFPTSVGAATVTDRENNDSVGSAQSIGLGDNINGAISEKGDLDFYKFSLPESGKVSMKVTAYMALYSLNLYDGSGDRIWNDEYNGWNEAVGFRSDDYDLFLEKGTYYLEMRGSQYSSSISDRLGNYSISMSFLSANATESEPNNSVADASTATFGDVIRGVIAQNGDYDFYEFTLPESGKVSMKVTAYMALYSLNLYDGSGNRIWNDEYNGWNEAVGFRSDDYDLFLEKGTYYLEMRGSQYSSSISDRPGIYSISMSFISANATETEPNNSVENANIVTLGSVIRGVIAQNGDRDFYKFTLTESTEIPVKVTAYMAWYSLNIYDISGNRVWYSDWNGWNEAAGYSEDEHTVTLKTGTYYLEMRGSQYSGGSSNYPGNYSIVFGHDPSAIAVTGVSLHQSNIALKVGNTATLIATVLPANANDKSVSWSSSNQSVATVNSSGVVTAVKPGTAVITVTTKDGGFIAKCTVTVTTEDVDEENRFKDVPTSSWCYDAVQWAVEQNVTSGTSTTTFSPNATCTRAQAVTFLWRAAGSPEPSSTRTSFQDVIPGQYYYKAVLWAVENGITSGTSSTTFSPNQTCSRSQIVTFQWRAAGQPSASGSGFYDVPYGAFYSTAVAWAVNHGITSGTGNGKFSPGSPCTRAQIVTFLYRAEK
jgi:hypothetical protein